MINTKKVLGICTSHRKNGNSSIIVNELLRPSKEKGYEVEILYLGTLKIMPCSGCFACNNAGFKCVLKDDLELVKSKIEEADAIAISSPSYYLSTPSTLKAIMDRTAPWALDRIVNSDKKKYGVSVSVAGGRSDWFTLQRVFSGSFLGLNNCEIVGQYTIDNTAFKGEVLLSPSKLKRVNELGKALVESIEHNKCIKSTVSDCEDKLICQNCLSDVFQITKDGNYICPVCNMELKHSYNPFKKEYHSMGLSRFTPAGALAHINHIGGKILNGIELSEEINKRLQEYLDCDMLPDKDFIVENGNIDKEDMVKWDNEALEEFNRLVPRAFHGFVKKAVAKKAAQKGIYNITKEVFLQIKKESGN